MIGAHHLALVAKPGPQRSTGVWTADVNRADLVAIQKDAQRLTIDQNCKAPVGPKLAEIGDFNPVRQRKCSRVGAACFSYCRIFDEAVFPALGSTPSGQREAHAKAASMKKMVHRADRPAHFYVGEVSGQASPEHFRVPE